MAGSFLRARDPEELSAWYRTHLGIQAGNGGSLLFAGPQSAGRTVFTHFPLNTPYFGEGLQQAMVNSLVDNLDELLGEPEASAVRVNPKREDFDYGRFGWIWDGEENRVELWEPARERSGRLGAGLAACPALVRQCGTFVWHVGHLHYIAMRSSDAVLQM